MMRMSALGLLDRLQVDMLFANVQLLFPVLECYTGKVLAVGYPWHCLLSAFKVFSRALTMYIDSNGVISTSRVLLC
jgi:hypothetical protein